uniref:Si:dkey-30c15.13 n=1 Tax=Sphaeramia orbicularis TaxID=375764 RepID=A0A673AIN0_9TELE
MTQNMFQEGLYHVYFKETPSTRPLTQVTDQGDLKNARIHRWFATVVNTRLLVAGVVQVLSAVACILTTVTHACVSYNCSVSMTTPVWSSIFYVAAGCLAVEVQRKVNKVKVNTDFYLHFFFSLFLPSFHQRAGSLVAKGSSIVFSVQCFLLSLYILFLSWRGLRRYSPSYIQTYSRVSQDADETNGPLLEQVEYSL